MSYDIKVFFSLNVFEISCKLTNILKFNLVEKESMDQVFGVAKTFTKEQDCNCLNKLPKCECVSL